MWRFFNLRYFWHSFFTPWTALLGNTKKSCACNSSKYGTRDAYTSRSLAALYILSKWNPENTQNLNYVEPDVFIRFSEFDVTIEAKLYEEGLQNSTQWEKEIIAYRNEYGHCKKLYFIALGGLCDDKIKQVKKVPIFRCLWSNLLDAADKTLSNDECFCSILRLLVG